jgi:hypothetical protein
LTAVASLLTAPASADSRQDGPEAVRAATPLFSRHSLMHVTIEAPLTTLKRERPEEQYLNGVFRFTRDDGTVQALDLKIRTRGKYRRMEKHCDFPPIRLNFRKKQVANTEFAGQDKLKLVTHCQSDKPEYEQLVVREYLVYRIFNEVTDKSYRVRLFNITYVDTEGGHPITKFGFAIEDADHVGRRVGMQSLKIGDIGYDDLDHQQENVVNVFQYMIGNTDFSLVKSEPEDECCHNSDLMSATDGPPYTPLPFDFDFAGLVSAPYAEPHPRYGLRSVRQRMYKGHCKNNELLPDTLRYLLDKKAAIYDIVDKLYMLATKSRHDVKRYLEVFYEVISDQKKVRTRLVRKCNDPTKPVGIRGSVRLR